MTVRGQFFLSRQSIRVHGVSIDSVIERAEVRTEFDIFGFFRVLHKDKRRDQESGRIERIKFHEEGTIGKVEPIMTFISVLAC